MKAAILGLGTAVPPYKLEQAALGRWIGAAFQREPALARWMQGVYDRSGIEHRYTVLPDFLTPERASLIAPNSAPEATAGTAERMAIYRREAVELGSAAARQVVQDPGAITHLIVASCTGFFAPGLDLALARRLGLPATVRRTVVGFMGCAATFNSLRLASEIVAGAPDSRVLVVSVELCTLHLQAGKDREGLVAASLFADGASAALVGRPAPGERAIYTLDGFYTSITPDTENAMVWEIGNHGFALRLSPRVPLHLAQEAPAQLARLLGGGAPPAFWALHPGGRAILDRLEETFGLNESQLNPSRHVLQQYGNMSSATILFVLDEMARTLALDVPPGRRRQGVAMGFGPGLVTEMALLTYTAAPLPKRSRKEEPLAHLAHS